MPRQSGVAEVVRMSVAQSHRRDGIGRRILLALLEQARSQGFRQVILETTATWHEVVAFYLKCGFHITYYQDGDVYFSLNL